MIAALCLSFLPPACYRPIIPRYRGLILFLGSERLFLNPRSIHIFRWQNHRIPASKPQETALSKCRCSGSPIRLVHFLGKVLDLDSWLFRGLVFRLLWTLTSACTPIRYDHMHAYNEAYFLMRKESRYGRRQARQFERNPGLFQPCR